jgi:hypothetical protein
MDPETAAIAARQKKIKELIERTFTYTQKIASGFYLGGK